MEFILKNRNDFEKVITANKNLIIDFYATWCGPCKMLTPILNEILNKNLDWNVLKIDIDQFNELAIQYNIEAVPTLLFMKDSNVVGRSVGFKPSNELQKILDKI